MAGNWRENLEPRDQRVIELCLRAVVEGPFIEEWEFQTLIGFRRGEVRAILDAWPALPVGSPGGYSSGDEAQRAVAVIAMNNLLGYPHGFGADRFTELVGVSEREVRNTFLKVRHQ